MYLNSCDGKAEFYMVWVRAVYRVRYFLGTDRIASIPSSTVCVRVIRKHMKRFALYSSLGPAQSRVKSNTPISLHRLHSETWLTREAAAWKRPRCKTMFTLVRFCIKMKLILEDLCPYYTTESARYVTIHVHCSIIHKTINKIYIPLLLKTHFKPPSSVCNNFRLPSNVFFGHVMLLKYMSSESEQRLRKREGI